MSGQRPQFGNRYLTDKEEVFEHNAWDDVDWDEEQEQSAKDLVASNSSVKLDQDQVVLLDSQASLNWDRFYNIHQNRFFKDRNWLFTEFPDLAEADSAKNILEVGCGVGNTVFPILERNPDPRLKVYCCDYSPTAVALVTAHPHFNPDRCVPFVCDVSQEQWDQAPFESGSLDAILLLFALSAVDPDHMVRVAKNVAKYLKPGGKCYFRDYGRYDMAQLRFKSGKCIKDNFYARGDGTRCYFFEEADLVELFEKQAGLLRVQLRSDRRLQVNRGKKLKMYRVWIQAQFQKKPEVQ